MSVCIRRIAALLALLVTAPTAWASCGSAMCPIDTKTWERRQRGQVRLGYQMTYRFAAWAERSPLARSVGRGKRSRE